MQKFVPFFLLFALVATPVRAAVPFELNYQGLLTGASGHPVNATSSITFNLYTAISDVDALWTETLSVDVENGIYSVVLGANPANPIPPSLFEAHPALGVAVGSDPEMTPRQKLTSVGFSIRASSAEDADLLGGQDASSFAAANHSHSFGGITGTLAGGQLAGTYSAPLTLANGSNLFSGSGSGLTGLNASQLSLGTVPSGRLSGSYSSSLTFSNIASATVTSLTATTLASGDMTSSGNLILPETTASTGIVKSGANTLLHTFGTANLFAGVKAGNLTMTGSSNTALGTQSMLSNTTGGGNTALGTYALYSNTSGNSNAANGAFAMYANTIGASNTAMGHYALLSNATAGKNTAFGDSALLNQSFNNGGAGWDSHNTAVGFEALFANQPTANDNGVYNTAVGSLALRENTTGDNNTATGAAALGQNTAGVRNTAFGAFALQANTLGSLNTALGFLSLFNNTTASNNTAVGVAALRQQAYTNAGVTYQTNNTAVGYEALYANNPSFVGSAMANSALGAFALHENTVGMQNTAIGESALYLNTTASKNIAVGSGALRNQSYAWSGLWDSHNTALGFEAMYTNQPTSTGNGRRNTAVGSLSMRINTTGYDNTALGYNTLENNVTNSQITAVGSNAGVSSGNGITNATAIGYNSLVTTSNSVRIGNNSVISIGGSVDWSASSDERLKTDIRDIEEGIDFIKQLRPISFKKKIGNGNTDFGFIAQDIEALLGDTYNLLDIGGGEERLLSLRYTQFIAPLVKAMQEQQEIIEDQQAQIDELRAAVAALQ